MKKLTPLGIKTAVLVMEDRMIADVKPRAMQLYLNDFNLIFIAALGKATKYIDLLVRVQNETQKM